MRQGIVNISRTVSDNRTELTRHANDGDAHQDGDREVQRAELKEVKQKKSDF